MGKVRKGLVRLAVVILALGLALLLDRGCLARRLTGIPCPGCGLSRAWLAALRLDFRGAFAYHPMFWSIPALMLFVVFDGKLIPYKRWNALLLYGLIGAYFVCYGVRLVLHFM